MIAEKKIKSGPLLEVDFFPAFNDGRHLPSRMPKSKATTEAQAKYNRNQLVKKTIHMVNANFDSEDIFMAPTYETEFAPMEEEQAYKDISNYLRRIKYARESALKRVTKELANLPNIPVFKDMRQRLKKQQRKLRIPFKYYYTIEKAIYKTGRHRGKPNYHIHLFCTGGLDPKEYERQWPTGLRTNANRFQPEKFGPEAAARYICKEPEGKRRVKHSRNLIKFDPPPAKPAGISPAGLERIAKQRVDDAAYWERKYKGYKFVRCFPRFNPYNGYWYVSVIMYKSNSDPPPWKIDDWLNE